jgi:hypothetical protein
MVVDLRAAAGRALPVPALQNGYGISIVKRYKGKIIFAGAVENGLSIILPFLPGPAKNIPYPGFGSGGSFCQTPEFARHLKMNKREAKSKRFLSRKESIWFLFTGPIFVLASISEACFLMPDALKSGKLVVYKQVQIPESGYIAMLSLIFISLGTAMTTTGIKEYSKYKKSDQEKDR